ncbi:MAG: hypothetical protein ACOCRK_08220 [bacterium]
MAFETEVKTKSDNVKPHLVILGAGASLATLPDGDKNGLKLPLMNNFIETVGLEDILEDIHLETDSNNFEDIYSELYTREYTEKLSEIEDRVYDYFCELRLPENPTIYDYLILSLREKDAIATFNWDPLLVQAIQRVQNITDKLPELIFLHGNVWLGICDEHKMVSVRGYGCPKCGNKLKKVKILYPIREKNYSEDEYIQGEWEKVKYFLEKAFSLTIFGYGVPESDRAAISLFKEAWGDTGKRSFEEVEIIDIKESEELRQTWNEFIHTHHYRTTKSYFNSQIALCPRRSIEAYYEQLLNAKFVIDHKISPGLSFNELKKEINGLIEYEEK